MLALRRSVFAAKTAVAARICPRRGLEEFFDKNPIGKQPNFGA